MWASVALLAAAAPAAGAIWLLVVSGRLTLDTGIGRTTRALGPLSVEIEAPRERVFELLAVPYAEAQPPRAVRDKVQVLERGQGLVLAAHRTPYGPLTVTTLETVALEPPARIRFRLVRGPVPHVTELFELEERDGRTRFTYTGEMGADFWLLGRAWTAAVARTWTRVVATTMRSVAEQAEAAEKRGKR